MKKKKIIERLLLESSLLTRSDYFKQYAILRTLVKKYPNENFWSVVNFGGKLKSLYFLKTEIGQNKIDRKYKEFKYKPKGSDKNITLGKKKGKDTFSMKTKQTVKDFLND